jgi:hypothetical protein
LSAPIRAWRVAVFATFFFVLAAVACNGIAELDVNYAQLRPDGSVLDGASDDGSRKVRDSGYEAAVVEPVSEYDGSALGQCEGGIALDSLCDPSAGVGCCIRPGGANESVCLLQLDFQKYCLDTTNPQTQNNRAMFVACVESIDDNQCCWREGPNKNLYAVYTKSCAAVEAGIACNTNAGCPEGQYCNTTTDCHFEITLGLCGPKDGGPPPCPKP